VEFEYDPDKSKTNARKHGIDFEQARLLWSDAKRVEFVARFADETRLGLVGGIRGETMDRNFHHQRRTRKDNLREEGEKK
jgi:uncharacterized DUF497 family protein